MVIHTHDCPVIAQGASRPGPVCSTWSGTRRPSKPFDVSIQLVVANQRGVLAKVAAEIAEAGSNIQNVAWTRTAARTPPCTSRSRSRTACTSRGDAALRRIPEVVRIVRVRDQPTR